MNGLKPAESVGADISEVLVYNIVEALTGQQRGQAQRHPCAICKLGNGSCFLMLTPDTLSIRTWQRYSLSNYQPLPNNRL